MIRKQVAFGSSLFLVVFTVPFKSLLNKADALTFINPAESRSAMAPDLVYDSPSEKRVARVHRYAVLILRPGRVSTFKL